MPRLQCQQAPRTHERDPRGARSHGRPRRDLVTRPAGTDRVVKVTSMTSTRDKRLTGKGQGRMTAGKLQAVALLLCCCPYLAAQPTYRLEVRPFVKPRATLTLDGTKVKRSAVKDDPGFRLQYHIKKDGKTL